MKNRIKKMIYEFIEEVYDIKELREIMTLIKDRVEEDEYVMKEWIRLRNKIEKVYLFDKKEPTKQIRFSKHAKVRMLERFGYGWQSLLSLQKDFRKNIKHIKKQEDGNYKIKTDRFIFVMNRDFVIITAYERKGFKRYKKI